MYRDENIYNKNCKKWKTSKKLQKYISISNHIREIFLDWCIFPYFLKKKIPTFWKNYTFINRFHIQILLNDFGFRDFSIDPRHVGSYGKIPNLSKSSPGGMWKRLIHFLPTCHKGLHDHLRTVMSMHFWRFFLPFFNFLHFSFSVNWTICRSFTLEKIF